MKGILKIGITDCGKYDNYRRWIETVEGVEAFKLSMHLQNADEVDQCDGVLFSGGEDVDPVLYGHPEYVKEFGLEEIIPARDQLEFQVIQKVLVAKKPVLGICRGLQLINVFLGGSLIPDIPSLLHSGFHGKLKGVDQVHAVHVDHETQLFEICGKGEGLVNSAHHQSAALPAPGLKVVARADSGIVEAMEWKEGGNKSWLQLVQWHPERMADQESPFSLNLRTAFLKACKSR